MGKVPKCSSRLEKHVVDRAWREEHIGVKIIPLTYVVQKVLMQNVFPKNVNLTFDDLLCTHYWSDRQSEGTGW